MTKLKARAITTAAAGTLVGLALALTTTSSAQAATATGAAGSAKAAAVAPKAITPEYSTCTGTAPYDTYASSGLAEEYGWYYRSGSNTCVGQADLWEKYDDDTGRLERVRVWSPSGGLIYQGYVGGSGAGTGELTFIQHVNELFPYSSVEVCTAVVLNETDDPVDPAVPILCETV